MASKNVGTLSGLVAKNPPYNSPKNGKTYYSVTAIISEQDEKGGSRTSAVKLDTTPEVWAQCPDELSETEMSIRLRFYNQKVDGVTVTGVRSAAMGRTGAIRQQAA